MLDSLSPDGEEFDAYILGVDKPLDQFEGICIAVIHRLNDKDDKLVVVPEQNTNISDEEKEAGKFSRTVF